MQGLDGFYVPHEDEYQNEYLPDANERLAWATGFTGSFGSAFVFSDEAVLFVDGRYTIQGADQTDPDLITCQGIPEPGPFGWLAAEDKSGQIIGYDPRLMTPNDVSRLSKAAEASGASLRAVEINPIDAAWDGRPPEPCAPMVVHPDVNAGKSHADKRAEISAELKNSGADAAVITSPSSIAWLFNIRGGDVACTPLPLGRAIIQSDGSAELYVDDAKVTDAVRTHLGNEVSIHSLSKLEDGLAALKDRAVSLDPALASAWFFDQLETAGAKIIRERDPVALPRACKNEAEIAGTTAAHERDGIAVTRFLHWLATDAQFGEVTEIDAALKLESFREELGGLEDLSFGTISGAGPNGALPHYRVSMASNRTLERGTLYLVDSGGQYLDGTTDITRTVPIGAPTDEMKRHYTLVLKGHIALATVRFPHGTTGTHLDVLARQALWNAGLDYDHGTGHGVGVYLGVHEGPQRISKAPNDVPLQTGMIVSNEPGFYKEGAYGIRIENLQYVIAPAPISGGEREMYGFQNLTWAPLSRELIDISLLTLAEIDWVNAYHAEVMTRLSAGLPKDVLAWCVDACATV